MSNGLNPFEIRAAPGPTKKPTMRMAISLNPFEIRAAPGLLGLKKPLLTSTCEGCYGLFSVHKRCLFRSACKPWLVAGFLQQLAL